MSRIVIVGGGSAGWMTAAALSNKLGGTGISLSLVESPDIATVGVGEATVPHIRFFNSTLGIDEAEFIRCTKATFKLGIEFRDWARIGDSYIHPFGAFGTEIFGTPFLQQWVRANLRGEAAPLEDFSLPIAAARRSRFARPAEDPRRIESTFSYAYQFDASLYARFLRRYSEDRAVERIEGTIVDVRRGTDGSIESVVLKDGREIEGDLFVDCSGFRGLLIAQEMGAGFESWRKWLPCDRAIAVPCSSVAPPVPYTRATAMNAGWIWRIPLQHRVGNGHVYCSDFMADEEAERILVGQLESEPLAPPNRLRFEAGKRDRQWVKNCVAIGLSAGFLEPLESTSIHLIQLAITNLVELLPEDLADDSAAAEFNRVMDLEYERIRDFLILHYCATERDDSDFWRHCRTMELPNSLKQKIELFRERGIVAQYRHGMFLEPSWIAVFVGQRVLPDSWSAVCERVSDRELDSALASLRASVASAADAMPRHIEFIGEIGGTA